MKITIVSPGKLNDYFVNREVICSNINRFSPNPLLLNSIYATLKKFTNHEIVLIDLDKQDFKELQKHEDSDYLILLNSNLDYSHNKEFNLKILSMFPCKKICVLTPGSLSVSSYKYPGTEIINSIVPEIDVLKIFGKEIEYKDIPIPEYDRSKYEDVRIDSGRGCPFRCIYCSQSNTNLYLRSPESIIEELKLLKKQGVKHFRFLENEFTINHDRALEICKKIQEENLKMSWRTQSRIDLVDEELIKEMAKAGCVKIDYGIESVNPKTLGIIKKNINIDRAKKIIKMSKKYMTVGAYFIIGLPEETKGTILNQLDFIREVKPDYAGFHPIFPEPGTEFYKMAIENNWVDEEDIKRWSPFSENIVVNYPHLSSEDIIELTNLLRKETKRILTSDKDYLKRAIKFKLIKRKGMKTKNVFYWVKKYITNKFS